MSVIDLKKRMADTTDLSTRKLEQDLRLSGDPVRRAIAPLIKFMEEASNSYSELVLETSTSGRYTFRADLAQQFKDNFEGLVLSFFETIDEDIESGGAAGMPHGIKPDVVS